MYGDVVLDLKPQSKTDIDPFEEILERKKQARGVKLDTELTADDLRELVGEFKAAIRERKGVEFPEDPQEQLWGAIGAVFGSWMNDRAIAYRKLNNIPESWGTAVNVQSMVFGNLGDDSGTGVAFTRDPATGENIFYGEFLMNAQGEDVVAGTRTPLPISAAGDARTRGLRPAGEDPAHAGAALPRDDGHRVHHRAAAGSTCCSAASASGPGAAAIRIAVDMVKERLITPREALLRVEPDQLNQLLRPTFRPADKEQAVREQRLLARGLNAGPGAATGKIMFHAEDAEAAAARGEHVILVRIETSPEDIRGMAVAGGHPDRTRRHDESRRAGGTANGQGVCRRLRGVADRLRRG